MNNEAGSALRSEDYLTRFLGLHPKLIDLTLDRTVKLLKKLGDPQSRLPPVIHVAGTNGKGSTIAFMRAMLEAEGRKVHVYTSPHLVRFHERIRVAGALVEEGQLIGALARCEAAECRRADHLLRDDHRCSLSSLCRDAGRYGAAGGRARRADGFHQCRRSGRSRPSSRRSRSTIRIISATRLH